MITIGQMVKWIMANRGEKCFGGYTADGLAIRLDEASRNVNNYGMFYATDVNDNIKGIVLIKEFPEKEEADIIEILVVENEALRMMTKLGKQRYDGWTFHSQKRGKNRTHNVTKLFKKIL